MDMELDIARVIMEGSIKTLEVSFVGRQDKSPCVYEKRDYNPFSPLFILDI